MDSNLHSQSQGSLCKTRVPSQVEWKTLSKVNSCAWITASHQGLHAHPFYYRKGNAFHCESNASSTYKQSWSSSVHKNQSSCTLGSQRKPLVPYDPNHPRSRMGLPKINNKDQSILQSLMTQVSRQKINICRRSRHNDFKTIYMNSFQHPAKQIQRKRRFGK